MAKIFLDTNILIDLIEQRRKITWDRFLGNSLYISTLSINIYLYTHKGKVPNKKVADAQSYFNYLALSGSIVKNALLGPTNDFEDNIELHSAASEECHFFLTEDKQLLRMIYFGKVKIINNV